MDIFHKIAWQGLKKNRAQTLVTVIGVSLSAAMITAVVTFAVSLQRYVVDGATMKYGGWQVSVSNVDSLFIQGQEADDRVEGVATLENIGYAALVGGKNPDKPYLFIAGFNERTFDTLPLQLLSGRMPEDSGELLVPAHVAANGGVQISVGDTLALAVGNRADGNELLGQPDPYRPGKETLIPIAEKAYTVVGIYQRPAFEQRAAPGYTLLTRAGAATPTSRFSAFITLKKPSQIRSCANYLAQNHPYALNDDVLRFMGLSDDRLFNALLYSTGGILVLLIMLGSVFLIYNSFHLSLNERTHQMGILLSVGCTEKQLRKSVLFEGLCIGAVGIPAGICIGIPSIGLVLSLVARNFQNVLYDNVPLTLQLSVPSLAAAGAISLITILLSAYIPARKAAATPVMECIRQVNEIKVEAKAVNISPYAQRVLGLEGTLALKNFRRNRRRYRSIVLSLVFSVVLFVSASSFRADLKQQAAQAAVEFDGNVLFSAQDMEESELFGLYDALKDAGGVYKSTYQALSTYSCVASKSDLAGAWEESPPISAGLDESGETVGLLMDIQFIEDSLYRDYAESLGLPAGEYTGQDAKMIVVGKTPGSIDLFNARMMDFTISAPPGQHAKTISATFADSYPLDPPPAEVGEGKGYVLMAIAPYRAKPQFDTLGAPTKQGLTFWSENPAQSVAQMQAIIEGLGVTTPYHLYNLHAILEQNRNIIFIVELFALVFVSMIALIALANVFNTISTNIRLRRRELAMLRSIGMPDGDFNRMMCLECAFYGIKTLLCGLPLAGIISWVIYRGMLAGGADIGFVLPLGSLAASAAGVLLAVFITMLYAVRRIKRETIVDALRDDMA